VWEVNFLSEIFRKVKLVEKKRGEERTGPALNPLKGSSARLPHAFLEMQAVYQCTKPVFSQLRTWSLVKMHYPLEKMHVVLP
jgi:hypothetical protein